MGTTHLTTRLPSPYSHKDTAAMSLSDEFHNLQKAEGMNWICAIAGEFDSSTVTGNGLDALKSTLEDDKIQFGTFQVLGVDQQASGPSTSLELTDRAEVSPKFFGKELLRVGGAHKPTHYDFGEDVTISITAL